MVSVPLRIHPVQCKGHDGEDVCSYGIGRPGGIDLAGGHIFKIVLVADVIVLRSSVAGTSIMDDDIFRDNDTAQDNLTAFIDRFDLGLGNLGRIGTV